MHWEDIEDKKRKYKIRGVGYSEERDELEQLKSKEIIKLD